MFPDEDGDDGSNIFDSPSQIVNGNHRINLKREPQDEDRDGDDSYPSTSGMYCDQIMYIDLPVSYH